MHGRWVLFCASYKVICRLHTNLHHFIELAALDLQRNQFWLIEATKLYDLRPLSFTVFSAGLPIKFEIHKEDSLAFIFFFFHVSFFCDFNFRLFCILRGISGMHCCRREKNHKEDFLVLQIVLPLIDWPHFGFEVFILYFLLFCFCISFSLWLISPRFGLNFLLYYIFFYYQTQVQSLPCLVTPSLHTWISLSCYMDLSNW